MGGLMAASQRCNLAIKFVQPRKHQAVPKSAVAETVLDNVSLGLKPLYALR